MNNIDAELESSIYKLFDLTPTPTVLSLPDGKLEYVNPAFCQLLGYDNNEIFDEKVIITHPGDIGANSELRSKLSADPFAPVQIEKRYLHKNGHTIYGLLNIVAQPDEAGRVRRFISQVTDLSVRRRADASEILLSMLIDSSNDAIYVVEPKFAQILNCNELAHKRLGYEKDELLKLSVLDIASKYSDHKQWTEFTKKISKQGKMVVEGNHKRKDGSLLPVEASISFSEVDGKNYLLAIVRDISKWKDKESEATKLINLDPLTQAYNRRYIEHNMQGVIEESVNKGRDIAIMYIDLNDFKRINDTFGHSVGDGVLVETTQRLKNHIRDTDILARLGGDEFLIVLSLKQRNNVIEKLAVKLLNAFNQPLEINDHSISISISIGISTYSDKTFNFETLIAVADKAMYKAKKLQGQSYYCL